MVFKNKYIIQKLTTKYFTAQCAFHQAYSHHWGRIISCSPVLLIPYRHIAVISKHSPPIQPSRSFFYSHKDKQVIYEYKEKLLLKAFFSIQNIDSKKFKYMVEYSMEDTIGKLVCEKKVAKKIFLESK